MGLIRTDHIYGCDICGTEGLWTDDWLVKDIPHFGPVPYDQQVIVCSDDCAAEFDRLPKKDKNKLGTF